MSERWTRSATFVLINRNCVEFRGPYVREHYIKLFRRGPVYNTRTKSWVTTPQRMKDLVCQLERHGYDIVIQADPDPVRTEVIGTAIETTPTSRRPASDQADGDLVGQADGDLVERLDPGQGLW